MTKSTCSFLFFFLLAVLVSCANNEDFQKNESEVTIETPKYLYKILTRENWEKSCTVVSLSKADTDFIHLATEEQLARIISKFWSGASEYVILKLETERLPGELVHESNPGGKNKYYHLYQGTIPLGAIIELKVIAAD
ncbi:MAG: DUF952 domain-containing protein [Chlamydiales bacterium]|nr:DUF952 domain-containing protein [Chlamydiales bacterium]